MTTFIRATEEPRQDLLTGAQPGTPHVFIRDPEGFRRIPGTPFAYWAPFSLVAVFETMSRFEAPSVDRLARVGLQTSDDFRFVRLWYEVGGSPRFVPLAKGGAAVSFYADLVTSVLWHGDGAELKAYQETTPGTNHWSRNVRNTDLYFRPGVTWPLRSARFTPQALPEGSCFTIRGAAAFLHSTDLLSGLAVLSSTIFDRLYKLGLGRMGFPEFAVGVLQRLPWPSDQTLGVSERLSLLAHRGWSLRRSLDTGNEVSHAFVVPALLQVEGEGFVERVAAWGQRVAGVEDELAGVQSEIDEVCFDLYGIGEEDRRSISEGFGVSDDSDVDGDADDESDDDDGLADVDPLGLAAGLVSWCVGVVTGRFDVRLATGERDWPEEPDPFDPLPVCSAGMLTGEDGLPLVEPPDGYPMGVSPVLVVDPGHRLDVTAWVRGVFDVVIGAEADRWWTEVGETLDSRSGEVGAWLGKSFFDHHLKTYSKSRRKAPLVWPIGTESGSYQVWLYAHRMTADSLFRVLNDLIVPKLNTEESRLVRLRQEAGPNPSASDRKAIDAQEKFVSELVELRETVEEVAPLWAPDLNDGIVILLAPLWRLFSHHKPWMRELKKHWQKLAKGEYDWAQLAMHLWPERVIPNGAEDRSLAIAHGLEDVFWQPDPDNDDKWIQRDTPATPIDQLINQHHNPTIKTALTRLSTS